MQILTRFYGDFPHLPLLELTDAGLWHQLTRVLRAKKGQKIELFSDIGGALYSIVSINKNRVTLAFEEKYEIKKEMSFQLAVALPNKFEKLEFIVQKGTELGVSDFFFFPSQHSQCLSFGEKKENRLQGIAREAVEQSGRYALPKIHYEAPVLGEDFYVLHQEGSSIFENFYSPTGEKQGIIVGPEGGWSEKEVENFRNAGCSFFSINSGVLRMETAAIVGAGIFLGLGKKETLPYNKAHSNI